MLGRQTVAQPHGQFERLLVVHFFEGSTHAQHYIITDGECLLLSDKLLDAEYAARTPFGGRIAHAMLSAAFISAVLGNDLPGPGTIYLGQTLKFLAPVRIGDTITASVEVTAVREEKRIVTLRTD